MEASRKTNILGGDCLKREAWTRGGDLQNYFFKVQIVLHFGETMQICSFINNIVKCYMAKSTKLLLLKSTVPFLKSFAVCAEVPVDSK